jgi:hypothetical protein
MEILVSVAVSNDEGDMVEYSTTKTIRTPLRVWDMVETAVRTIEKVHDDAIAEL